MVWFLALLGVILFVLGMSFVFKSYKDIPAPDKIVPLEEYDKARQELESTMGETERLKKQLDALAIQLEETRTGLQQMTDRSKEYDTLKAREQDYQEKIRRLQSDLDFLFSKADRQAVEASELLQNLKTENERLQADLGELEVLPAAVPADETASERESQERQIADNLLRIGDLERQLTQVQGQAQEKMTRSQETIGRLSQENKKLQEGITHIVGKVEKVETAFAAMLAQKERQLQDARDEAQRVISEVDLLKDQRKEGERKMAESQEALKVLQEQPAVKAVTPDVPGVSREPEPQEIERLKEEIGRLKEFNEVLARKEETMIFELTKSRAKVMGLEKICRDLREQGGA